MARNADSTKRLHDRWAQHLWVYEAMTHVAFFGRRESLRRRAVASLELQQGDTVVSLACGSGADLPGLRAAVGVAGVVIGVDLSPGLLAASADRVRREGLGEVELIEQDLARLDLGARRAEGAVISLALSALPDRPAALERVRSLLRPGASLAVLDTLPFQGWLKPLNPLIGRPFRAATNWDYKADLISELEATFDRVEAERLNGGSALLARAAVS